MVTLLHIIVEEGDMELEGGRGILLDPATPYTIQGEISCLSSAINIPSSLLPLLQIVMVPPPSLDLDPSPSIMN